MCAARCERPPSFLHGPGVVLRPGEVVAFGAGACDDSCVIGDPYECPSCATAALVPRSQAGTPMHDCPGHAGMTLPLVAAGTRAEHRMNAREDYVGAEDVRRDADGGIWMSATTITDDAEHCTVFAPTAYASIG